MKIDKYYHLYSNKLEAVFEEIPNPVRRGHWEDCSNGWMCSVCEHDARKNYSYCPNCGADMRGGQDE